MNNTIRVVIFFFSVVLYSCSSNEETKNDLINENLLGKVKLIEEKEYFYDENIALSNKYVLEWKRFYKYDVRGNCEESSTRDSSDNLWHRVINIRDSNDRLIQVNWLAPDGSIKAKDYFKYEKENRIEKLWCYADDSAYAKEVYKYNDDNVLEEMITYNADGSLKSKSVYFYDESEQEEVVDVFVGNDSLQSKFINKYDDKENLIGYSKYNSAGVLDSRDSNKYDDKGNVIVWIWFNSDGSIHMKEIYKYEFDKIGNWLKKVTYENGKPKKMIVRKITYY